MSETEQKPFYFQNGFHFCRHVVQSALYRCRNTAQANILVVYFS